MWLIIHKRKCLLLSLSVILILLFWFLWQLNGGPGNKLYCTTVTAENSEKKYIKWAEFNVPYDMLEQAMEYDINSSGLEEHLSWIEILAYLSAKNGGVFRGHQDNEEMDKLIQMIKDGYTMEELTLEMPFWEYYLEMYDTALSEFIGTYDISIDDDNWRGGKQQYGLKLYSPIAKGYGYGHYDDFGVARNYGYQRTHLGNDLMGAIGTPIVAVEGGIIEALGWNQYGGWRIGIRSFDRKRYYYYAHLRKNHPFHNDLQVGDTVAAGDVIGYLGMTGYSATENVNNIATPHLHFGLQLIFDESQKDGDNQIWLDVYNLVRLLDRHRAEVVKDEVSKEYYRVGD